MTNKIKSITLATFFLCAGVSKAQTLGYVTGGDEGEGFLNGSLTSFNATTGGVVSSFTHNVGAGTPFAVGTDDSTLYIPALAQTLTPPDSGTLYVVSGQTGQLLNSVALPEDARKTLLSNDGSTVYVMTSTPGRSSLVQVLDTATLATTGTISFGSQFGLTDIALSPDNSTLYVAFGCASVCRTPPPNGCTATSGICIFNASTLAFEDAVAQLAGDMAVSQDGKSLYVVHGTASHAVYVVNTSTLAVSAIQVSLNYAIEAPVAISPTGNYGLIFVGPNAEMSTTAFILDTTTNTITNPLFGNAPGGAFVVPVYSTASQGNSVAFTPKGKSVWMLLECYPGATNCTIPGGTGRAVFGIQMGPGAAVIAETSVPQDAQTIAFPN